MFDTDGLDSGIVSKIDAIFSIDASDNFLRVVRNELFDKMNFELGGQTGSPSDKKKELCYLWDTSARFAAQEGDIEGEMVALEILASISGEFSVNLQKNYLEKLTNLQGDVAALDTNLGREVKEDLDWKQFSERLRNGNVDEIVALAGEVISKFEESRDFFDPIGTALYGHNRKDLAARYWQLGVTAGHPRCAYLLGELAREAGKSIESRNFYLEALRMGYESARYRLDELDGKSANQTTSTRVTPAPKLIRSWEDAEQVCLDWMRFWGFTDAKLTQPGADGGIDITSSRAVAQVKFLGKPIGRENLQKLHGASSALGKQGFFFSLTSYTSQALEFASSVQMPLFQFNLQGLPEPMNSAARNFASRNK